MENFIYSIPTTIYFGKGQIEHVAQAVRPYGKKALIVYGGGSVKKNGIFDRVTEILEHEGIAWEELGGVEPNPRIETVRKGAELCKEMCIRDRLRGIQIFGRIPFRSVQAIHRLEG